MSNAFRTAPRARLLAGLLAAIVLPSAAGAHASCLDLAGDWDVSVGVVGTWCVANSCQSLAFGGAAPVEFQQNGCEACWGHVDACGPATNDSLQLSGPIVTMHGCDAGSVSSEVTIEGPASENAFELGGEGSVRCRMKGFPSVFTFDVFVSGSRKIAPAVCGDATEDRSVTAADSLRILRVAVGQGLSCPLHRCDVDDSGAVMVTDALLVLRTAVGQGPPLWCPAAGV